jgi:hypothetical protein
MHCQGISLFDMGLTKAEGQSYSALNEQQIILLSLITYNRTAHIIDQCRKTTVLACHRSKINTGVEKMNNIQI